MISYIKIVQLFSTGMFVIQHAVRVWILLFNFFYDLINLVTIVPQRDGPTTSNNQTADF